MTGSSIPNIDSFLGDKSAGIESWPITWISPEVEMKCSPNSIGFQHPVVQNLQTIQTTPPLRVLRRKFRTFPLDLSCLPIRPSACNMTQIIWKTSIEICMWVAVAPVSGVPGMYKYAYLSISLLVPWTQPRCHILFNKLPLCIRDMGVNRQATFSNDRIVAWQ